MQWFCAHLSVYSLKLLGLETPVLHGQIQGNWSAGVPDAMDTVAIFDVANDPTISAAGAVAKLITVYSGAVLTISSGATLAVNGSSTHGILNYGTVTNSGVVNIGSISSSGLYGIRNHGIFNNNTGGQININQTKF